MIKIYLENVLNYETRCWEIIANVCIPDHVYDGGGERLFSAPLRDAVKTAGKTGRFIDGEIVIARLLASSVSHSVIQDREELVDHLESGVQVGGLLDHEADIWEVGALALRHIKKRPAFDPLTDEHEALSCLVVVRDFECDPHVGRGLVLGLIYEHIVGLMNENIAFLHIEPELEQLPADQRCDGDRRKQEMNAVFAEVGGELKAFRQVEDGVLTIASIGWHEFDLGMLVDFSEDLSFMRVEEWARATYGVEAFDPEPEAADQAAPAEDTVPDITE